MRLVFTLFSLEYVCIAQTLARLYATLSHASNLWFTRKKQILFLSLSLLLSLQLKPIYFKHLQCNYKWQQKIKINDSPISVAQCMWTGAYRRSLSLARSQKNVQLLLLLPWNFTSITISSTHVENSAHTDGLCMFGRILSSPCVPIKSSLNF